MHRVNLRTNRLWLVLIFMSQLIKVESTKILWTKCPSPPEYTFKCYLKAEKQFKRLFKAYWGLYNCQESTSLKAGFWSQLILLFQQEIFTKFHFLPPQKKLHKTQHLHIISILNPRYSKTIHWVVGSCRVYHLCGSNLLYKGKSRSTE